MIELLAQQPPAAPDYTSLLNYGVLGLFAAVCLWFLIVYGKRGADGHLTLVDSIKEWIFEQRQSAKRNEELKERTTIALETLTETQSFVEKRGRGMPKHLRAIANSQTEILTTVKDCHREVKGVVELQEKLNAKLDSKTNDPALLMGIKANKVEYHDHSGEMSPEQQAKAEERIERRKP